MPHLILPTLGLLNQVRTVPRAEKNSVFYWPANKSPQFLGRSRLFIFVMTIAWQPGTKTLRLVWQDTANRRIVG